MTRLPGEEDTEENTDLRRFGGHRRTAPPMRALSPTMLCSCCGEDHDPSMLAALHCHDAVRICRICLGWLMPRAGGIDVTPTLLVADMNAAIRFYETADFHVEPYDDGFAFVRLGDPSASDLDLRPTTEPATNGAGCYIITADVDGWHDRLVAAGLPATSVEDMPWGMHDFTLVDPSGNQIPVGHSSAA